MDSKEYIASGIIERYVLGLVSPQEKQEVECMSHIYPEIGNELTIYQESLEKLALLGAVDPPSHVKDKLMEQIRAEKKTIINEKASSAKIIEMVPQNTSMYKYVAAASVVLVVGMGIGLFSVILSKAHLKTEMANLTNEQDSFKNKMNQDLKLTATNLAFLSDVNTKKITMKGTEQHPDLLATVYWNSNNQKVMLAVNEMDIPPSNKQYQLWAIVDGQPKDMGLFDMNNTISLQEMKLTSSAQAFAVTLEPMGGSLAPSMDQMHVLGTI